MTRPDIDSHWNFQDPEASEQGFKALLDENEDAPVEWQLEVQTQMARALGLQGRFDEAHSLLGPVSEQAEAPRTRIRHALELGRLYNSSGDKETAREHFQDAFELATEAEEDFFAIDAAHMMGIANPPEKQLEWSLEALRLAEASDSDRARNWLGSLYNNIGWSLHELDRHDEALELFEKALEWREEQGKEPALRIAKWTVGRQLRQMERYDEALEIQEGIIEEYGEENADGYLWEEYAENLHALGRREDAVPHFSRAHATLSEDAYLKENEPERLERLAEMGSV